MKNHSVLFSLTISAFLFCAAGCGPAGPEAVALKFLNGFEHMDFDAARSVATEETKRTLNMMEEISKKMVNDSIRAEQKRIKVKIINVKENGDEAVVTFTTSQSSAQQRLNLKKDKERWLVAMNKTDLDQPDDSKPANMQVAPTTDSVVADSNKRAVLD